MTRMSGFHDCSTTEGALTGLRMARGAIGRGDLVVLPTDTVYGIACDAFNAVAVAKLLSAKGRGRQSPPPVLVGSKSTLGALAENTNEAIDALTEKFWPGGLTIIVPARGTLKWDLGETNGTVAVRMPDHPLAIELLTETGPLAVSSANLTGKPAALNAAEAKKQLGDSVSVYLEAGNASESRTGSTIVDATGTFEGKPLKLLREGSITKNQIEIALAGLTEVES